MTNAKRQDVQIEMNVAMRSFGGANVSETVTVPREEWESMTPAERRAYCENLLQGHIDNEIEAGYSLGEDEGSDED